MRTGVVLPPRLSSPQSSRPVPPGSRTSRMITSNEPPCARSRPSANVAARVGSMRCARRPSRSRPARLGSSSTISTRMEKVCCRYYDSISGTFLLEVTMAGLNVPLYDPRLVQPMREELTRIGFQELRTPGEVDAALATGKETTLVVVNSVCGCAARNARPAATLAIRHANHPQRLLTVFAGQDADATARARSYFTGYAPSSPQMALFRDGQLVYMLERKNIEGRPAQDIAADLTAAFERYC